MEIANTLISNGKRTDTGEIIVTLFEFCDLHCLFCNQDHSSIEGIDSVKSKIHPIIKSIEDLQSRGKDNFEIHIMGGEVFSDKLPDSIFDDYAALVDNIRHYSRDEGVPIEVSFVTNFIFNKKQRVKHFLTTNDIKVFTSYDPAGRFTKETFEIFKQNVVEFTPMIQSVNCIMTKQNIQRFMKGQVDFFDYLYDNFPIYFDYYTPERHYNELIPADVELRDFIKCMLVEWPECLPFKDFTSRQKKNMTCMDTYTIMPDNRFGRCTILLDKSVEDVQPINLIPLKPKLEQQWFDEYNCLECEHFDRCSLGCFLSNHIKGGRTQKECWLKQVYDFVDAA